MIKEEFTKRVIAELEAYLPAGIRETIKLEPVEITKINDQKQHGIRFDVGPGKPSPTIYLDDAFEDFIRGRDINDIANHLAMSYAAAVMDGPDVTDSKFDVEHNKDNLTLRLLDVKRNREYLRDKPHMSVGNGLAMVCDIRVADDNNGGFYTTTITNGLVDDNKMDRAEIFSSAMTNAGKMEPALLTTMESKLFGLEMNLLEELTGKPAFTEMYILTNRSGVFGASTMFYPGVQEKISKILDDSYYAIPSSLHEFIIVPESVGKDIGEDELATMVVQTNRDMIEPKDVLSDNLFKYDRESRTLSTVRTEREKDERGDMLS